MANWDIPTTGNNNPTSGTFGDLNPHAVYNLEVLSPERHIVWQSKKGVVIKMKTINGDTGVGTFVSHLLGYDPESPHFTSVQQPLILKLVEAAGLDRFAIPTDDAEVIPFLMNKLSGKVIAANVKEGTPYNGNKQWQVQGFSVTTKADKFLEVSEGDLIDQVPTDKKESISDSTDSFDF